jgi:hypothetical protein
MFRSGSAGSRLDPPRPPRTPRLRRQSPLPPSRRLRSAGAIVLSTAIVLPERNLIERSRPTACVSPSRPRAVVFTCAMIFDSMTWSAAYRDVWRGRGSYPKSRGAAEEASQSAAVQRARSVTASLASGSAARLETSATRRNIKGLIASVRALRALPIKCAAIRSIDATEHGHALANHSIGNLCRGAAGRYPGRIGAIAIFVSMVRDQGPQRRDVLLLHQLGTMPDDTVRNRRPLHPEPLLPCPTAAPASTAAHRGAPKVSFCVNDRLG